MPSGEFFEPVPDDLHVVVAGFPCTSASVLNRHSHTDENRSCIARGDLATGSVLRSIVNFIRMRGDHMHCVILENVTALAKEGPDGSSNLDAVIDALAAIGWWAKCWHLDPRDFGCAVSRPRIWLLCLRLEFIQRQGLDIKVFDGFLESSMNLLVGSRLASMEDYLL
jgi:site-specific DNA-cytosine methylase